MHVPKRGRVPYMTAEEAQDGANVLMGTLLMNFNSVIVPAVVLFYSRASHSFITMSYTQCHKLKISVTSTPYLIDTPGANVLVNQCVTKASVQIYW